MALAPRQTGSSIKFFILAAALQAGAQPDDIIDGRPTCARSPCPTSRAVRHQRRRRAAPDTLAEMTWRSINCAYVRLAQIVGLNRVVDTDVPDGAVGVPLPGPAGERAPAPIEPFVSFSTGANEMSPIDMASGAQTIANDGLHHEPYYVDYIDDRRRPAHLHPRRRRHPGARPGRRPDRPSTS